MAEKVLARRDLPTRARADTLMPQPLMPKRAQARMRAQARAHALADINLVTCGYEGLAEHRP